MRRHWFAMALSALALSPLGSGCSGSTITVGGGDGGGSRDGSGSACATDADCGTGGLCGFPTADQCAAHGQCFPGCATPPCAQCQAFMPGCACDGSIVNLACNGLPGGYAPKPLLHTGTCEGGGPSACTSGGGTCVERTACPAGYVPSSLSCGALSGSCCVPVPPGGGSFTCGNKTCVSGQYCTDHPPGILVDGSPPADYYECDAIPASCASSPTCACIEPLLGGACTPSSCTESSGQVTVHCLGV